ncbi:MAG TPA: TraR/DksA family transcriptional regulator [Thermoanaerobaculia bacterium]|jgi:DnaK suppressor protein|nr:TraR/DksA family transcriptional regulator [Thermoanaerobaculia bacterium]
MSSSAKAAKVTKKETEKYRRALVEKKDSLSQEMVKNKDAGQENSEEITQDIADKASSSYTKEFLFSLSDGERVLLQQIDQALVRVEEGGYGLCTNCRNPIPEKRLEAVPWTPYCVDCMELSEKGLLD